MSPETLDLIRSNRPVQAALAAVVLLALVGTAKLVGSVSSKPVISSKASAAAAASAAVKPAPELGLAPNETLVVPAEKASGPLMPHYSAPQPPPVGRTVPDQPQAPAAVVAEGQAALVEQKVASLPPLAPLPEPAPLPAPQPVAPTLVQPVAPIVPQPAAPAVARAEPQPLPRSYCPRCGEVVGLTYWPDMTEVRVRFQDGSTHAMRGPAQSRWRVGDRVRAEGGRLVAD